MNRQQQLCNSLREVMELIETNQLVRNTMADGALDWMERMVNFVGTLKRAKDLLEGPWCEYVHCDRIGPHVHQNSGTASEPKQAEQERSK